ncbi:hypothetical protein SB783_42990, partial [Paraburkholderia sp. SIMBA_009]
VRLSRTKLGQEFRALLIRLAIAANAVDAEALADTLMMLWENATSNFKSGGDSRRVAQRLPTLVDHIIKSYVVLQASSLPTNRQGVANAFTGS